jgi:diacylglycerol kinase (ATP)
MPNSSERDRALILVNPRSRRAGTPGWRDRAVAELATRYAVEVVTPADPTEMTRRARVAAGEGYGVVIAAGGDGTVNAIAQGLRGTDTALGILALGSANDLARELGIPRDVSAAAWLIATGTTRLTDLVAIGERVFCGVGGIALVARAALAVTRFKQRSGLSRGVADMLGGGIYRVSATAALLGTRSLDHQMHVLYHAPGSGEQRMLDVRASALFVANHRTLGGGLVLPIDADPSDGVLEICVVPARARHSLILNFARLSAGRRIPPGVLEVVRATDAIIETSSEDAFVADGELLATGQRFEVRVLSRALQVKSF